MEGLTWETNRDWKWKMTQNQHHQTSFIADNEEESEEGTMTNPYHCLSVTLPTSDYNYMAILKLE